MGEGVLTLARYRLPVVLATFRRVTANWYGEPGWDFTIRTGPPSEMPDDCYERQAIGEGVEVYCAGGPVPLNDCEDLTGAEVYIAEPFDPATGDNFFGITVLEHDDVSDLTLKFVERRGSQYRLVANGLAHCGVGGQEVAPLAVDTWIERLPAYRYGDDA
jgi:hypothetical protein